MPSAHLGHLGLWDLKDDDYPNSKVLEDWPSWTLPVLQWGKSQGAVTGYVHTGWGMEPEHKTNALPNYVSPKMNGIGANEYVVTVVDDVVDLFGVGDTAPINELNTWYHALNAGFRTRISGESDFPCIYHERIGIARGYAKLEQSLNFQNYIAQMKAGRSYVSDGRSHIIDFQVMEQELGVRESELNLTGPQKVTIKAKVTAYLPEQQDNVGEFIANSSQLRQPAWHLEKSRLDKSRNVIVELIINGSPVERRELAADGVWQDIEFMPSIDASSWVALRIYPSSHTNPIFVIVDGKPIRASKRSAEWMRSAVDKLWEVKSSGIRDEEKEEAQQQYQKAKRVYDKISAESELN